MSTDEVMEKDIKRKLISFANLERCQNDIVNQFFFYIYCCRHSLCGCVAHFPFKISNVRGNVKLLVTFI